MACRLFGAEPLPETMLIFCPLDPREQTSVKFEWIYNIFHSWKCIWKCRLRNNCHFVQGDGLKNTEKHTGYIIVSWPNPSLIFQDRTLCESTMLLTKPDLLITWTEYYASSFIIKVIAVREWLGLTKLKSKQPGNGYSQSEWLGLYSVNGRAGTEWLYMESVAMERFCPYPVIKSTDGVTSFDKADVLGNGGINYSDVIMGAMASHITSLTIVLSPPCI